MYARASATLAIGPTMASLLTSRGAPVDKVHSIFNWAHEAVLLPKKTGQVAAGRPGTIKLMYAGNLGDLQDLDTILRAMALVSDLSDLHLDLVGAGMSESRLRRFVAEHKLTNVTFHGRVAAESMKNYYLE